MNDKLQFNQEMKESEIEKSILLLGEAIKRKIIVYEHANPTKENCYISSGYISGLYFPNSVIYLNNGTHKNYDFVCIAKIDFKLCFVYSLKENAKSIFKNIDLKPFFYDEIESVIYSYEERKIKSQLEKRLCDYEKTLCDLNKITRNKTKAGEDFKVLNKCFNNCVITLNYNLYNTKITGFKINYGLIYRYFKEERENINADDIQNAILQEKERLQQSIKNTKNALKNVFANYTKMLQLKEKTKAFFDSLTNGEKYIFSETFKTMI